MEIDTTTSSIFQSPPSIATVGMFDGVHAGHVDLLNLLIAEGRERGLTTMVITFRESPLSVINPEKAQPRLLTLEQRVLLLRHRGVDKVVTLNFNEDFAKLSAEDFLKMLAEHLNVKVLVMGYNNHIGHDRLAYTAAKRVAKRVGIEVIRAYELVDFDDSKINSTLIRRMVSLGLVDEAAKKLEMMYCIPGTVVLGQQIGRTLGFPTANIRPDDPGQLIPHDGVYAVVLNIEGYEGNYYGMCSIGTRPTFGDDNERTIEVNIFDFDDFIYGKQVYVTFIQMTRPNIKFPNVKMLKAQMRDDRTIIRRIITRYKKYNQ